MKREVEEHWQRDGVRLSGDVIGLWLETTLLALPADVIEAALVCSVPAWFDLRLMVLLSGKDEGRALGILAQLLAADLVVPAADGGFVYREGIRERLLRVWESPARGAQFERVAHQLAEHYFMLAYEQQVRLSGDGRELALAMLDKFYPNLEACWEAMMALGECDFVYRWVAILAPYHAQRQLWQAQVTWLESGVAACECLHDEAKRAEMLNRLGVAYMHLVAEGQADAVAQAIACYEAALAYYNSHKHPLDYAMVQNNLGNAYVQAQERDPEHNLARAKACYEAALQVCAHNERASLYAVLHANLGFVYLRQLSDPRARDFHQAIAHFEQALRIYTLEHNALIYAKLHLGIGSAHAHLLLLAEVEVVPDLAVQKKHLRAMIASYQAALRFYMLERWPQEYADIQSDLANAYTWLVKVGELDALWQAIAAYEAALQVHTLEAAPQRYAGIKMALGLLYSQLPDDGPTGEDAARHLRRAIACYQAALQVYALETMPMLYAQVQVYLGFVYAQLSAQERVRNLHHAFAYYQQALKGFAQETGPSKYADVHTYLGALYTRLATLDADDHLRQAIACYEASLAVYTSDVAPQAYARIKAKLAALYTQLQEPESAPMAQMMALT